MCFLKTCGHLLLCWMLNILWRLMKNENASFGPQPKTTKRLSHVGIATAVQKLTVFLIKIVIQECVGDGCESFFFVVFLLIFFFLNVFAVYSCITNLLVWSFTPPLICLLQFDLQNIQETLICSAMSKSLTACYFCLFNNSIKNSDELFCFLTFCSGLTFMMWTLFGIS